MEKRQDEFETVYTGGGMVGFVPQANDILMLSGGALILWRSGGTMTLVSGDGQAARDMWDALYPRIEAANAR
jgi:hypothetical protein